MRKQAWSADLIRYAPPLDDFIKAHQDFYIAIEGKIDVIAICRIFLEHVSMLCNVTRTIDQHVIVTASLTTSQGIYPLVLLSANRPKSQN